MQHYTRWGEVDFERCVLSLRKAKAGAREVPLSPGAIAILKVLQANPRSANPSALEFPITYECLKSAWNRACVRANVMDANVHDLRHTAATRFSLEFHGDMPLLKVITGHKTDSQLQRYVTLADVAITGDKKGINKRVQYAELRKLVRDGKVDVVVCDQLCRLARHAAEALDFFDEMKASGVRLITSDGFDSDAPTSQLLFGIKAVFAQFFLEETRHRVKRGMNGGFKRGAMVTAIPAQLDDGQVTHQGQGAEQIGQTTAGRTLLSAPAWGNPLRAPPCAASPTQF